MNSNLPNNRGRGGGGRWRGGGGGRRIEARKAAARVYAAFPAEGAGESDACGQTDAQT